MSKKSFATATDGSTVTFDFDQSKSWQVTLAGNRTAVFAGAQEGDVVTILITQDSTGSRTLTWPSSVSWSAGPAPGLKTAAGSIDAFTFILQGSTWREVSGGSPARLPTRLKAIGLATIIVAGVGGAMVGTRFNLTQGSGEGVGNLPNAVEVRSNSGTQLNTVIDGSGSVAIGSGFLLVGSLTNDAAAKFKVLNNGTTTIKATASAALLTVGGGKPGRLSCFQTGGTLSYCQNTPDAVGCACK